MKIVQSVWSVIASLLLKILKYYKKLFQLLNKSSMHKFSPLQSCSFLRGLKFERLRLHSAKCASHSRINGRAEEKFSQIVAIAKILPLNPSKNKPPKVLPNLGDILSVAFRLAMAVQQVANVVQIAYCRKSSQEKREIIFFSSCCFLKGRHFKTSSVAVVEYSKAFQCRHFIWYRESFVSMGSSMLASQSLWTKLCHIIIRLFGIVIQIALEKVLQ